MIKENHIKSIVIAGGGSSGWMSAAYLQACLGESVHITVVSPDSIGRIGVGEATVPSIKPHFFDVLGLKEQDWMPECNASYKLGIRFENWRQSSNENPQEFYYHLFGELPEVFEIPLSQFWLAEFLNGTAHQTFSKSCYPAYALCENKRAPISRNGKTEVPYAYHFDAIKLADYLMNRCVSRGVRLLNDVIVDGTLKENGEIKSLILESGAEVHGDLFIDCTGFERLLIGKILKEPFVSFKENLITDSAVTINTQIEEGSSIDNYTTATALNSGWCWKTPLTNRTGNGYVYSSQFCSPEQAETELRGSLGDAQSESRLVKFESGRMKSPWVKNCVSIGLASGFLEPLESTGLYFVYAALHQLVQHFPDKQFDSTFTKQFNSAVTNMIDEVRDFIVLHFTTSGRSDTEFWKYCTQQLPISSKLEELLAIQKAGLPISKSFGNTTNHYTRFHSEFSRFWTNSNYQSVLFGVNKFPTKPYPIVQLNSEYRTEALTIFKAIEHKQKWLLDNTDNHMDYLSRTAKEILD